MILLLFVCAQVISDVASCGEYVHDWPLLRTLLCARLDQVRAAAPQHTAQTRQNAHNHSCLYAHWFARTSRCLLLLMHESQTALIGPMKRSKKSATSCWMHCATLNCTPKANAVAPAQSCTQRPDITVVWVWWLLPIHSQGTIHTTAPV